MSRVNKWGEPFFDHFYDHLGDTVHNKKFEWTPELSIQIISYNEVFEGCRPFCTFGLSKYLPQIGHPAEIFMAIDSGWNDVAEILAASCYFLLNEKWSLAVGSVFRFDKIFKNFSAEFNKVAIYFRQPFGLAEEFGEVVNVNGERGTIYMASFITESELDYLLEFGPCKFEEMLEINGVDVFSLRRK